MIRPYVVGADRKARGGGGEGGGGKGWGGLGGLMAVWL